MQVTQEKIYLIGFMGSGKSYLGQQLAQALQWDFVDMDAYLEEEEGKTISQIFADSGESGFRILEKYYLRSTSTFQQTIIATGGGAPCFFDNIDWMNQNGQTIYLKTAVPILINRLKSETSHRPLLANKTKQELANFIQNKLDIRSKFYEQAGLIFEYNSGMETASDLLNRLNKVTT